MRKYAIPISLAGSVFMAYVISRTGSTLKTASTPLGILDLEFAYDTAKTSVVMNAWAPANNTDNIAAAKLNTGLDFIFLFFYSLLLFFACKKIAQTFPGTVEKAGNLVAKGALFAGLFDVLENAGMLLTLSNYTAGLIAFLTTFFSVMKWALATIAVMYVLTGILLWAYQKFKD
jgi:hypothetical protein